jgi:hypothetical protein
MPDIEFEVTEIDKVEEEIREAYVEKDGKFRFDPDKYHELKAAGLIAKNKELIGSNKKLSEQVKSLEKVKDTAGTDADRIAQEKDQQIAELKRDLRESKIWTPVQQLAIKHGVLPDRVDAVMTLMRANNRFDVDDDGNLVFNDKRGEATAIKPVRAFEVYLREEIPWAFEASKTGGSGAKNGAKGGGGRTITRESWDGMSEAQRSQAMKDGARVVD